MTTRAPSTVSNRHYRLGESDTLHTAAERGRADLARLLLGRGTDIDALGFEYCAVESRADEAGSELHFAVDGSSVEIVELFLEYGADAGFKDVKETTAVQRAKEWKGLYRSCTTLRLNHEGQR